MKLVSKSILYFVLYLRIANLKNNEAGRVIHS